MPVVAMLMGLDLRFGAFRILTPVESVLMALGGREDPVLYSELSRLRPKLAHTREKKQTLVQAVYNHTELISWNPKKI